MSLAWRPSSAPLHFTVLMSSNATHEFPSPIGGVPYPIDFAPSILFSVLHGLLIPVFAWRMARSQTRTFVLIGAFIYAIERYADSAVLSISRPNRANMDCRTVLYALRAYASRREGSRESNGLETYFQTTLAGGYITLGQDLTNLARALFVNATKGSDILAREAKVNKNNKPDCGSDASYLATIHLDDHPKARTFIRRVMTGAALLFWVTIIIGIVASVDYPQVLRSGAHASTVRTLWYAARSPIHHLRM